mmetsp:Transcript_9874/g.17794  ORF Transcript_9874/g.17794 Transcript_9874/m.17794 type:complete len:97 (+) Transcript_9874:39-329(+)
MEVSFDIKWSRWKHDLILQLENYGWIDKLKKRCEQEFKIHMESQELEHTFNPISLEQLVNAVMNDALESVPDHIKEWLTVTLSSDTKSNESNQSNH